MSRSAGTLQERCLTDNLAASQQTESIYKSHTRRLRERQDVTGLKLTEKSHTQQ